MYGKHRLLVICVVLLVVACSSDDGGTADITAPLDLLDATVDLSVDVAIDSTVLPDGTGEVSDSVAPPDFLVLDDGYDVQPEPDLVYLDVQPEELGPPGPVTESSEPVPVVTETWLVTYAKDSDSDPVGEMLDAGTFEMPDGPGIDGNGIEWLEREPGDGGKMGFAGYGLFYAATTVEFDKAGGVIVRANKFSTVYINGRPQPATPYNHKVHRTPGAAVAGTNVIIAQAFSAVNDPEIELWTTPDELYFNPSDITAPHMRIGEESTQYIGIPVLNLTEMSLRQAHAKVIENEWFEATDIELGPLSPAAVTQIAFQLKQAKAVEDLESEVTVTVRVESPVLEFSYEFTTALSVVAEDATYKRTRHSLVDGSVQFYGVRPPTGEAPDDGFSLALSLHGAGVGAHGQVNSYSPKDWAYVVAPTNRRPFGFDWEEWGRLDGLETLDDAMEIFDIDPTRVYVTGHSMGGHGTWQFGVHQADRFRVVGPSAGWNSFYTYGGSQKPTGPFARARASSDTINYVGNLANRAVYIIHGDADDNVPISEAYLMQEAVEPIADEFYFHIEPGAGHWWNGDEGPGTDCVDWPPLFDLMQERTLDLTELDFEYISPSPWINEDYSYVTILSQLDPYEDSIITSESDGDAVALVTSNVRGMVLDGTALLGKGVTALTVDDESVDLADGDIEWGTQTGKSPHVQGPFNQVFHRPFCFVYPEEGNPAFRNYAAYLISTWNIIGNGHGCALPREKLTPAMREKYNIIYVGVPRHQVPLPEGMPFDWSEDGIHIDDFVAPEGTLLAIFPEGDHLSAIMTATPGEEYMLFWYSPFSSRSGMPDWVGWTNGGVYATGFFDGDWLFSKALAYGME
jgi:pimeloyl-ACP methyl ester carboxylesterase